MNARGFTLVETLVALVVLAVGLLALAAMNTTYVRANTASHEMSAATVLAEEKMEQLRGRATSERTDRFSAFDFDYLTSTDPCFSSVEDPPGSGTLVDVHGMLSGGSTVGGCTGAPVTTSGGTVYDVLYDDGNHGDGAAGDGVYGSTDSVPLSGLGGSFAVEREWTVEPLDVDSPTDDEFDFARLAVRVAWTDRGQTREVNLQSLVYRRQ